MDPVDLDIQLSAQDSPARQQGWATFSMCGQYRFDLGRRWDTSRGLLGWLMMNPSTAGARDDDATIRRVIGFSRAHGYGGFVVVNTTAYIATDSTELPKISRRFLDHPDNGFYQHRCTDQVEAMVVAFGVPIKGHRTLAMDRMDRIQLAALEVYALDTTKDGWPRHPLRLAGDLKLKRWSWPE